MPNIEDTFTYMCRAKCNQAKTAAMKEFDLKFTQGLKLPCYEKTLTTEFDTASIAAKESYEKNALGEEKVKIGQTLEEELKSRKETKITENET